MNAIDSSIVVAALFQVEEHHAKCWQLIDAGALSFFSHGLAEDVVPCLHVTALTPAETLRVLRECSSHSE